MTGSLGTPGPVTTVDDRRRLIRDAREEADQWGRAGARLELTMAGAMKVLTRGWRGAHGRLVASTINDVGQQVGERYAARVRGLRSQADRWSDGLHGELNQSDGGDRLACPGGGL